MRPSSRVLPGHGMMPDVVEEALYGEFQPEDVLDGALPAPPSVLAPGQYFPLARWRDADLGAVLYVYRSRAEDSEDPSEEYEEEVIVLRHVGTEWRELAAGGGDYVDPFHLDPETLRRRVAITTGVTSHSDEGRGVEVVAGVCAPEVTWVEITGRGDSTRFAIESPVHAFVAGVRIPPGGTVDLLDQDERRLLRVLDVPFLP